MSLPPADGGGGDDWFLDCGILDDLPAAACGAFLWEPSPSSSNPSVEVGSHVNTNYVFKEPGSNKRLRSVSGGRPTSKACREKMRRDKLNDRFLELGSTLEPGKPVKADKAAILSDATRVVIQLRTEAQQLKDTKDSLEEKIKELKAEKDELREEKQKLKVEKESLEHQMKLMTSTPTYMPHPTLMSAPFPQAPLAPFHAQGQAAGQKLMMPIVGYPGYPMWQFMPPSEVDTSKDSEACPPVA
ncbi:transcription factor ILR3-like [Phragmites australis]|uniref:transcription factor ILR3-like n=1 Tax=Phragmites australis TaxID=29695 RepID=UPI002D79B5B8|nr:transcription factor ILR3-like [Phragmites australis]